MAELFRYIEHSFVVPDATHSIDVSRESPVQRDLQNALTSDRPPDRISEIANDFIKKRFSSPVAVPFDLGKKLLTFRRELLALPAAKKQDVEQLIEKVFGSDAQALVAENGFMSDNAQLDDTM